MEDKTIIVKMNINEWDYADNDALLKCKVIIIKKEFLKLKYNYNEDAYNESLNFMPGRVKNDIFIISLTFTN